MSNYKYSVGDKVLTTEKWEDGFGLVIPEGSVVEIVACLGYSLWVNSISYTCYYNEDADAVVYNEEDLGEKVTEFKAALKEFEKVSNKLKVAYAEEYECKASNLIVIINEDNVASIIPTDKRGAYIKIEKD